MRPRLGAPTDFGGTVLANPEGLEAHWDTDEPAPTRLPHGVTFDKNNYKGDARFDLSNPTPADVLEPAIRTISDKMSGPGQQQATLTPDSFMATQASPSALTPDSFMAQQNAPPPKDQFTQDREVTEAWAQNHPIFGPIARFLVSGGQNAANAITRTPEALYHAIVDPPTPDELVLTPEQRIVARLGVKQGVEAGIDYASGKVTPKGAVSVLPEALGAGVGQAAGGSVYGKATEIAGAAPGVIADETPIGKAIKAGTEAAKPAAAKVLRTASDIVDPQLTGVISPRLAHAQKLAGRVADALEPKPTLPTNPGAPLPATPAPELLQANALLRGPQPVVDPAAGLGQIPVSPRSLADLADPRAAVLGRGAQPVVDPAAGLAQPIAKPAGAAGSMADSVTAPKTVGDLMGTPSGAGMPRTLSGESALRQILTGQDNANLLKIARSRGINVSQEAQLKPSVADSRLISKIIEDFSPEELGEMRDQYLENTRMGKHNFGDIGPEAWKTMSLQSYFPDVKIPASQMIRTRTAIANAPLKNVMPETSTIGDLMGDLKRAAKAAPKTEASAAAAAKAPATDLEGQLNDMLGQVKGGKKLKDLNASPDYQTLFKNALDAGPAWTPKSAKPVITELNKIPGNEWELRGSVGEGRSTSNDLDIWQKTGTLKDARATLRKLGFKYNAKTAHGETWTNGAQHVDLWDAEHEPVKDYGKK